ncbi:hypothetical protein M3Y94_00798700 [Aphelenchoides besseyi]|nr:hypothetical protein M3Y94_00798700 [Aphelenchoides besseyi]
MLYHVLIEAAAAIQQPNTDERSQGRLTLLDSWRYHGGSRGMLFDRTVPAIRMPTSGSDFQPFLCYVGIPAADLRMESAFQSGYAFYHTAYETYETMERLIDPTGAVFVAMAQFWMTAALRISENPIIPFDLQSITGMLSEWVRRLDVQLVHLGLDQALGSDEYREHFNFIDQSIVAFRSAATTLQQNAETVESSDIGLLNAINDRLMWIERSFVFDQGVYDNPLQRHVIYSPGKHRDVFPSIAFPGIIDPAIEWTRSSTVDDRERCLEAVRLGFAKLQYSIESATLTMYIDDLIY